MFASRHSTLSHRALLAAAFLTGLAAVRAIAAFPGVIEPGAVWQDNRFQPVQAHGGGVLKLGNTYYWFGEDRSPGNERGKRYVACYASTDLVNWEFRHQVLALAPPADIGPRMVVERPKVFYNAPTKKFVMYMHVDGPSSPDVPGGAYALARVGVATCDTVDGNYQFLRSFRPLGKESRDIGQFVDDDGTAYLIFESRPTGGFYIARLSADGLDVAAETCFVRARMEGGALVRYDGLYYLLGSAMTGWAPNPNKYATSASLAGPWSEFKDIAPPATRTYGAQSTMLLKVVGAKTTSVIFLGDLWRPRSLWDSRYLWMPLQIGNGTMQLPAPQPWTINVLTGETSIQQ